MTACRILPVVMGVTLLASSTWAQPPAPVGGGDNEADAPALVGAPPVDASRATSLKAGDIPAPSGPSPARSRPANVAPDVTVTGRRAKPCSNHDQACIGEVSAEIWRRYPGRIQALCDRQRIYAMREGFKEQDLGVDGVNNDHLTPQTEALCDYGQAHGLVQAAKAAH